ncbi:hypothetical protein [Oceanicaulis alexandrii]|uniref:hypothetical protein n=1 Tax=Oceanicaulis alexandrii TaxID=153233 RepID=UPI00042A17D0|nr:hypothetical protein [Oceanicaulis alexandrii]
MIQRMRDSQWGRQLREQATPRAMAGLAALVIILAVWGLGELSANVSSLRQDVEELQRAQRLELSLLSDQNWLEQAADLQAQLQQTQAGFWEGDTNGIVAAQLQGAVERAARNAELTRVRVNVESAPDSLGAQAQTFEVSLTARDTDGQFLALFQELSRTENQLVITRFDWRRSNGALDIRLQAPARIGPQEAAS